MKLLTKNSGCRALALIAALALAHGTASGQSSAAAQTAPAAKPATTPAPAVRTRPAPAFVYMLVPIELAASETSTKSGCWAKIFSDENYKGDSLTLAGPVSISNMSMTGPFGLNWDDRVNSIEIGPKATVTVFDNQDFRDRVTEFTPAQRVPDVSKKLGFFDEFASIRITCAR